MFDTSEYYGGLYPDPPDEVERDYIDNDYGDYYADVYHELDVLNMLGDE